MLSVVIPCRNEEESLELCLGAVLKAKKTGKIDKVVVVDNNSQDSSYSIAQRFDVDLLKADGNVSAVRNAGARHVRSRFIAFIDADVVVAPDWASRVHETIKERGLDDASPAVFGNTCSIPDDSAWMVRSWFGSLNRRKETTYINSGNMIVTRELFVDLGGFNEVLVSGEDVDLCERARMRGASIFAVPDLIATHLGYPSTVAEFFRRERWHGREMLRYRRSALKNRALLFALATGGTVIASATLFGLGRWEWGLLALLPYSAVLLLLSCRRAKPLGFVNAARVAYLFSIYGVARFVALIDHLRRRGAQKRRHISP